MYKISVPIMNRSVTPHTREKYLRQLKNAKVDRVFLTVFGYGPDVENDLKTAKELKENIDFFRNADIEADVWVGHTIGHGVQLSVSSDRICDISGYTHMMNVIGEELPFVCCPYDSKFRKRIAEYVAAVATSGAKTVLLDDDFRMSQHGEEFCCACDLHMARIRELCGENISREELKKLAFGSKTNKYRRAWLTAQSESLELLATDVRAAVDKVSPSTRVAFCTAHAVWGVDGTDPIRLARIMSGEGNVPLLRLHGAPYWAYCSDTPMASVIETARMFASFCDGETIETMAEGDVYPRPRYNTPAAPLEMFDAAMRIDGRHSGILKYMVDYNSSPDFEKGYISRHIKNLKLMDELTKVSLNKKALGINVSVNREQFLNADFEVGVVDYYPRSLAGEMMSYCGLSTVYGEGGMCRAVFGEQARYIDDEDISEGAIIDAIAAKIFTENGIDVGLTSLPVFKKADAPYLLTENEKVFVSPSNIRYAEITFEEEICVVCYAEIDGYKKPFAYKYQNQSGQKFFVLCFDAMALPRNTGMYRGYLQQRMIKDAAEWIAGEPLSAYIGDCPQLYVMCKGDGCKMTVALFNFFADSVEEPIINLNGEYSSIRFIGCDGHLNKNTVTLSSPISAYTFVAFEVEK